MCMCNVFTNIYLNQPIAHAEFRAEKHFLDCGDISRRYQTGAPSRQINTDITDALLYHCRSICKSKWVGHGGTFDGKCILKCRHIRNMCNVSYIPLATFSPIDRCMLLLISSYYCFLLTLKLWVPWWYRIVVTVIAAAVHGTVMHQRYLMLHSLRRHGTWIIAVYI